jgi:acyl-CoA thioester hydrolase
MVRKEGAIVNPLEIKIYYEDTDAAGVVYYANYLKYMERARTEFLKEKGIDVAEHHRKGILFAVVDADIHYKRPAKLGEIIVVTTEIAGMTHVTITIKHQVMRTDTVLVEANVRLACIAPNGKPRRIPSEFSSLYDKQQEPEMKT